MKDAFTLKLAASCALVTALVLTYLFVLRSDDDAPVRDGNVSTTVAERQFEGGDVAPSMRAPLTEPSADQGGVGGPSQTTAERWLPVYPSKSLEGLNGEEVLADYWGSRWPEIKEHLLTEMGERSQIEKLMKDWYSTGDHQSGDLDHFMKELPRLLEQAHANSRNNILGTARVVFVRCLPPVPFGRAFEARQFLAPAIESAIDQVVGEGDTRPNIDEIASRIIDRHGDAIQSSLDEISALAVQLDAELERALIADIREISPTKYPTRGELFVSPVMSTGAKGPRTLAEQRAGDVLRLSCGSGSSGLGGVFSATYTLDLRVLTELSETLRLVDEAQRRLIEWVDALIGVEVR
jgi:hypothetical protein